MFSDPLAYFLTWTTYGTWLPGDERGWVQAGASPALMAPDPERQAEAEAAMAFDAVILTSEQRFLVEEVIRRHCEIRGWTLQAVNVRTNHVHVVVTAGIPPEEVMAQLKAWASRRLSDHARLKGKDHNGRRRWWTEHGSTRWINNEAGLINVVIYVNELQ